MSLVRGVLLLIMELARMALFAAVVTPRPSGGPAGMGFVRGKGSSSCVSASLSAPKSGLATALGLLLERRYCC